MQVLKYLLSKVCQRSQRARAGVTFVEILVSSVLGAIVLGMIMIHYVVGINGMTLGMAAAEINSDGRLAMDRIVRDVRSAIELVPTRIIDTISYATGSDELIIKIYSIDAGGNAIPGTYDYVVYALDSSESTRLRKIVDPDPASNRSSLDQVIAENINSYSLSFIGSPVTALKIDLIVDKTPLRKKTVSQKIYSKVALRND